MTSPEHASTQKRNRSELGKNLGQEKNRGTAVVPTRVGEAESSGARQTIQLEFDSGPTGQLTDSSEEPMHT